MLYEWKIKDAKTCCRTNKCRTSTKIIWQNAESLVCLHQVAAANLSFPGVRDPLGPGTPSNTIFDRRQTDRSRYREMYSSRRNRLKIHQEEDQKQIELKTLKKNFLPKKLQKNKIIQTARQTETVNCTFATIRKSSELGIAVRLRQLLKHKSR